jgi:hypothetical protein
MQPWGYSTLSRETGEELANFWLRPAALSGKKPPTSELEKGANFMEVDYGWE